MNKENYISRRLMRTIIILSVIIPGTSFNIYAQLKLSSTSAMTILNGYAITSPPSSTINYAALATSATSTNTNPAVGNVTTTKATIPNDRDLTFMYQSAAAWWSGYLDYKAAAQSLSLHGDPLAISRAIAGTTYILSDGVFSQFQNYGTRRSTMIIRANDQSPVHFPPMQNINGADVQLNAYTPAASSFQVEVPLKF
jgi:hypothetical protein